MGAKIGLPALLRKFDGIDGSLLKLEGLLPRVDRQDSFQFVINVGEQTRQQFLAVARELMDKPASGKIDPGNVLQESKALSPDYDKHRAVVGLIVLQGERIAAIAQSDNAGLTPVARLQSIRSTFNETTELLGQVRKSGNYKLILDHMAAHRNELVFHPVLEQKEVVILPPTQTSAVTVAPAPISSPVPQAAEAPLDLKTVGLNSLPRYDRSIAEEQPLKQAWAKARASCDEAGANYVREFQDWPNVHRARGAVRHLVVQVAQEMALAADGRLRTTKGVLFTAHEGQNLAQEIEVPEGVCLDREFKTAFSHCAQFINETAPHIMAGQLPPSRIGIIGDLNNAMVKFESEVIDANPQISGMGVPVELPETYSTANGKSRGRYNIAAASAGSSFHIPNASRRLPRRLIERPVRSGMSWGR